jgi:hypothetical protein
MVALGLVVAQGCADESTESESESGTGAPTGTVGTGGAATGAASTGGAATGVGPSGGTGGTSTGTGSATGGTGTGPGASCLALADCCDELGAAMYSACVTVFQLGQEATCDSTLVSYHQNGYCTDSTACADLATCCPQLPAGPGWKDTCDQYVEINNAPQCVYLLGVYQQDGYCN